MLCHVASVAGKTQHIQGGEIRGKIGGFRQIADSAPDCRLCRGLSEYGDRTSIRPDKIHEQLNAGGFAGAIGTDEAKGFAFFNSKGKMGKSGMS